MSTMDILGTGILLFIIFIVVVAPYIVAFIALIISIFRGFKGTSSHTGVSNHTNSFMGNHHQEEDFLGGYQSHSYKREEPMYDPFDNHWESSFDWKDEDNDGYDDRDDGFWNEREF